MKTKGDIKLNRDVVEGEEICSEKGSIIINGNINQGAKVSAGRSIKAKIIFDNAQVTSSGRRLLDSISAEEVKNNVTISAVCAIKLGVIGNSNHIQSSEGNIQFTNVGDGNTIQAKSNIIGEDIGNNNKLKSEGGYIKVKNVGKNSEVNGYYAVTVRGLSDPSADVLSEKGNVELLEGKEEDASSGAAFFGRLGLLGEAARVDPGLEQLESMMHDLFSSSSRQPMSSSLFTNPYGTASAPSEEEAPPPSYDSVWSSSGTGKSKAP